MQTVLCFADNSASGKSIPFGQRRETLCVRAAPLPALQNCKKKSPGADGAAPGPAARPNLAAAYNLANST
jgi:hypothetical protein